MNLYYDLISQISKLDVPCFPTFICDSCLQFLVASYKFYIRCTKSNLKIQGILKEHKTEQINFQDTLHFKYRLCCPLLDKVCHKFQGNEDNTINHYQVENKISETGISMNVEFAKVSLDVRYSLNNEGSIFNYLQLYPSPIEKVQIGDQGCIIETNNVIKNSLKTNCCSKIDQDIPKSIVDGYEYEDELKKILSLNNGQLPDNLQVYLEHGYCKFGFKYVCEICHLSFPEEYLLKPHIETCHIYPNILSTGISKYQCIECRKKFKNFLALREHLKIQHVWYKCKVCQKQFIGVAKFELHVKKNHSGYRPFQCPICGKLFRTKLLFFEHEKYTHLGEKPYSCKYCNKKFIKLINLDMHMRTHVGENFLKCQDCDESFDNTDALEQHRKLNHVVKKILHECDLCLAEFTNLVNLTKHMKSHKDYKPHCCVICDRHFPTLRHLKEHIFVKHEKQEILMCELCNMTYLNETDLIIHVEQHV